MVDVLASLGFDERFRLGLEATGAVGEPGRVRAQHRGGYEVHTASGVVMASIPGKTMRGWEGAELPLVGDWVLVERVAAGGAIVRAIAPRRSKLARRAAGGGVLEQAIVANVDIALLVTGLDGDFNPRRLERYAMMAHEGGVRPVVALTKADLCPDPAPLIEQAHAVDPGIEVLLLSIPRDEGVDALRSLIAPGVSVVLLGSSGVGKSTLFNTLLGREELDTQAVRSDGKGRHTTTHRHLVVLPDGGILIDTPGMRELGVLAEDERAFEAFGELDSLASQCRFSDCKHQREPGCALRQALEAGQISGARVVDYLAMKAEAAWVEAQKNPRHKLEQKAGERQRSKALAKAIHRKGRA